MKRLIRQNLSVVCALGLLVILASIWFSQATIHYNASIERGEELSQAQDEQESAQAELEAAQTQLRDDITGQDSERAAQDAASIRAMLNVAMTWDSHESYTQARETMVEQYGLAEDSDFMENYLPPAPVNIDREGNEYPYIDAAGLESSAGEFDHEVLWVSGTEYRYMIFAELTVTEEIGESSATASRPSVVFATVDSDGEITEIEGYASADELRSS